MTTKALETLAKAPMCPLISSVLRAAVAPEVIDMTGSVPASDVWFGVSTHILAHAPHLLIHGLRG